MTLIFDYSRLLGKIKEKGLTQASLAKLVGLSESTFNLKLANKRAFKQEEIVKTCSALDVSLENIPLYFFCVKTSENGSFERAG